MINKILSVATIILSLGASLLLTTTVSAQTIISISPNSISMGSADTTLVVDGTGFQSGSKIRVNGEDLETTYVSSTRLTATVSADDLDTAGQMDVTVVNPNNSESNDASLQVTSSGTTDDQTTPGLPETGIAPNENNTMWNTIGWVALAILALAAVGWGIKKIYDATMVKR